MPRRLARFLVGRGFMWLFVAASYTYLLKIKIGKYTFNTTESINCKRGVC